MTNRRAARRYRIAAAGAAGLLAAVLLAGAAAAAEPGRVGDRFFFSGDGAIRLHHAHFGNDLQVRFRLDDGRYDSRELGRLRHFFRSRDDGREGPLSLRLVELLDFIEDRFTPSRMVVYSAYRSPELNDSLAGTARASLHTQGLAVDVGLEGVSLVPAWKQLRALEAGGMGYYAREGFLHVDTGKPRFWEAATSGVGADLSAGNARVFARTEFDRYATLDGLLLSLHSVTAVPLGLRRRVEPGLELVPEAPGVRDDGACLWIDRFADEYLFRLRAVARVPRADGIAAMPVRLELETCAPRTGATPRKLPANRIELVAADPRFLQPQ